MTIRRRCSQRGLDDLAVNRDLLQKVFDTLRGREVGWADIGERLGVSRQSAWERFS